jgi:23S rRNA-/tRNA-specific pseudouridylate synthase
VVVLARTLHAQRCLTKQFAARRIEKLYWALVDGYVSSDGEVDLSLLVDKRKKRVRVDRRDGKPAVTRFRIIERMAGLTLLECRPLTGRLHQIRVHLASIGHPLAVDPLYGGGRRLFLSDFKPGYRPNRRRDELPLIDRLTLHAIRITLEHPAGSAPETFEALPAKDFRATIGQLRRCQHRPG